MSLRGEIVKLAHSKPEIRKHLVPLLKQGAKFESEEPDWNVVKAKADDLSKQVSKVAQATKSENVANLARACAQAVGDLGDLVQWFDSKVGAEIKQAGKKIKAPKFQ